MSPPSSAVQLCQGCHERPAQVCDECRRACALKSFSGISRHPESGTGCLVCEDGPPSWCGCCWAEQVSAYRDSLREHSGRDIGRWPDYPAMRESARQSEQMMSVLAREQGGDTDSAGDVSGNSTGERT